MVVASFIQGNDRARPIVGPGLVRAAVSRLWLRATVILTLVPSKILASFGGDASEVVGIHPSFLSLKDPPRGTTGLALLPASPDCWLEALQSLKIRSNGPHADDAFLVDDTLTEDGSKVLNSMTCSWLTSEDQKVLALELSKCHMRDLGRPLFSFATDDARKACLGSLRDYRKNVDVVDSDDGSDAANGLNATTTMASLCLKHLTDAGVTTYTHFFSFATQLCTRLLSEVVLGQYYETSHHLAKSSRVAQSQMQALIEQQNALFGRWNERGEHVLSMYDQLETHVEQQTMGLESKIGSLHSRLDEEHKAWTAHYERFQEALATELKRHQEEIDFLTNIIRKTQKLMHMPWSWNLGLTSMWRKVQMGYSLFQGIIYNIGGTFCVWLLTLPRPFRWMRRYMLTLLMTELLVEIGILMLLHDEGLDTKGGSFWWRTEYLEHCNTLRSWLFHGNFNFFVVGILFSGLCGWRSSSRHPEGVRPDEDDDESSQEGDGSIFSDVDDQSSEAGEQPSIVDEMSLEPPTIPQVNAHRGRHAQPPRNQPAYFVPYSAMPPQQYYAAQHGTMPEYPLPFPPPVPPLWYDSRTQPTPFAARRGGGTEEAGGTADADSLSRDSTRRATAPVLPYPQMFHPWMFPYQMVPQNSSVRAPPIPPAMSQEDDSYATAQETTKPSGSSPDSLRTKRTSTGGATTRDRSHPLGVPPSNDGDAGEGVNRNGEERTGDAQELMEQKRTLPPSPSNEEEPSAKRARNGEELGPEPDDESSVMSHDESQDGVGVEPAPKKGPTASAQSAEEVA